MGGGGTRLVAPRASAGAIESSSMKEVREFKITMEIGSWHFYTRPRRSISWPGLIIRNKLTFFCS